MARHNVHPIAGMLLRCLLPSDGPELVVSTERLADVTVELERLIGSKELLPAITTLIRFCQVLQARGAIATARTIAGAARGVLPTLERISGLCSSADAARARQGFSRLLGERTTALRAPARSTGPAGASWIAVRGSR